jgi:hypothetical protein
MIIEADSADEVVTLLRRLLEGPSFRDGFPHLLDRRSRMVRMATQLLEATPEQFARVMNGKGIRPGQYIKHKMTPEAAAQVQENLKRTPVAAGLTHEETAAAELADLLELALELVRPNDTNWFEAFEALRWADVEARETGHRYDKHDLRFIKARKARRVLGQRLDSTDRTKLQRGRPTGSGWRGRIKTLATELLAGPPERLAAVTSYLRLPKIASTTTVTHLTDLIRKALGRKWPSEKDQARAFADIWRIGGG